MYQMEVLKIILLFILFLAALGLPCGSVSCCGAWWASFSSCSMPASVAVVPRLQSAGSIVVVHGLSCSTACGFVLNQGLNSRPLHWQVESYPLCHQGSPQIEILWSLLIVSFMRNTSFCALKGTICIISNFIPWSSITVILHSFTFSRILQHCFSHLLLFSM